MVLKRVPTGVVEPLPRLVRFKGRGPPPAKAPWFDGSGWCVLAKHLEAGSFQLPPLDGASLRVQTGGATFASLLAGIDLTTAQRSWFRRRDRRRGVAPRNAELRAQVATFVQELAKLNERVAEFLAIGHLSSPSDGLLPNQWRNLGVPT